MKQYDYSNYPVWFQDAVSELEQDLVDGNISHTDFNIAMEDLEYELYGEDYYDDDSLI